MAKESLFFLEKMAVGPLLVNCYLFGCAITKKAVIIDPGDEPEVIKAAVARKEAFVEAILLTHGHYDHLGAVNDIKEEYNCPIIIHPFEKETLTNPNSNFSAFSGDKIICPPADRLLEDKDIIQVGDIALNVIHTPGHSRGSVCFLYDNIIFGGDLIFLMSIGRTDLPGGSFDELEKSILEKIYTLPDETIIYPGHGEQTTVGFEKTHNSFVTVS